MSQILTLHPSNPAVQSLVRSSCIANMPRAAARQQELNAKLGEIRENEEKGATALAAAQAEVERVREHLGLDHLEMKERNVQECTALLMSRILDAPPDDARYPTALLNTEQLVEYTGLEDQLVELENRRNQLQTHISRIMHVMPSLSWLERQNNYVALTRLVLNERDGAPALMRSLAEYVGQEVSPAVALEQPELPQLSAENNELRTLVGAVHIWLLAGKTPLQGNEMEYADPALVRLGAIGLRLDKALCEVLLAAAGNMTEAVSEARLTEGKGGPLDEQWLVTGPSIFCDAHEGGTLLAEFDGVATIPLPRLLEHGDIRQKMLPAHCLRSVLHFMSCNRVVLGVGLQSRLGPALLAALTRCHHFIVTTE